MWAHSHLICEGQKVVVDENRSHCMVIMLQSGLSRILLTFETERI